MAIVDTETHTLPLSLRMDKLIDQLDCLSQITTYISDKFKEIILIEAVLIV